ncbi:MAG: hypothetical protein A3E02_01690 [Candidatus Zambryskibacteria bacterium RIFCSPHIGHO2_12_FULL_38_34]|uniref:Uncharacterized protein n=1 Tax=Candidatus Zambryskibacteria bacterium RIFCSPLOWO2_12_FULL_39_16 TaxID=1802775 RepID=A0A1G2URY0_9BACT|nr:MAG: hypothetical protein A3D37_00450 [Candidatus Zambryskibacteria bacterium RIFCSPHIGHO2_02_FULL_38_22]OHA97695.1 MAG: hypothetical protein A3E02_01690 [Candidatus Zambryskibacteria bacterium RIFCSPHIGHO2_12_FULL_38_34]OHB08893.1 MAG: hypothetical protein A3I19_02640 [Candidatus Zambryskibacteria bacterium RIFCSPLOWO2_02_FULL_38_13]OHB12153.1 MAG: hypothetical protein A3G46_02875 [Candidatus Zambryskibacteria bacterium RIFCSPLOWO2_12_FULL_39_16]
MPDNPVLFRHNFLPIVVRITSIPREEDPFKGIPLSVCKELIGLELKATFWSGPINDFFRKTDHRIVKWFVMCDEIKKKLVEKNSPALKWWKEKIHSTILVLSEEYCEVISR